MYDSSALEFVGRIYDTALQPQRWSEVMDEFAAVVSAEATAMTVVDQTYRENQFTALSSIYLDHPDYIALLKEYDEQIWVKEKKAFEALFNAELPGFVPEYQRMDFPDASYLEQHEPSLWFREHFNVFHRMGSRLKENKGWRDVVGIQYDISRGEATAEEIAYANQFIPHLCRAVDLGRDFTVLQQRFNAVFGALDHYRVGIWFVTRHNEVLLLNQAAEQIFDQKDGIGRGARGRLCITTRSSADLGQLIQACSATARGEGIDSEKLLTVERRSRKDSYIMTVAPMRDPGNEIGGHYKGAIVYAIDPSNVAIISTDGLAGLYGLTEAEDKVCRLLVSGHETRQIAVQRGVS
ncbi:MAG: hypothetical protein KAJ95_02430, partial [Gammaproteobacteria bacterium]|nr:hypothetical protein [Gammaproteobacteria bacterium]